MAKLSVEQDMKLGSALDQLEDAFAAAYAALKMVQWARLNVARYVGGVVAPELNAEIRSMHLDVEALWDLAQTKHVNQTNEMDAIFTFADDHNQKILDLIIKHEKSE